MSAQPYILRYLTWLFSNHMCHASMPFGGQRNFLCLKKVSMIKEILLGSYYLSMKSCVILVAPQSEVGIKTKGYSFSCYSSRRLFSMKDNRNWLATPVNWLNSWNLVRYIVVSGQDICEFTDFCPKTYLHIEKVDLKIFHISNSVSNEKHI